MRDSERERFFLCSSLDTRQRRSIRLVLRLLIWANKTGSSFLWLILMACQPVVLFYTEKFGNCIHCTFIFTFFAVFLRVDRIQLHYIKYSYPIQITFTLLWGFQSITNILYTIIWFQCSFICTHMVSSN